MRIAFLSAALLSAGCASSVCDQLNAVDLGKKAGECSSAGDQSFAFTDRAQCSAAIKSCSAADQVALGAPFDCLGRLPVCAASDQSGWLTNRQDCLDKSSGLSEACRTAVFLGDNAG